PTSTSPRTSSTARPRPIAGIARGSSRSRNGGPRSARRSQPSSKPPINQILQEESAAKLGFLRQEQNGNLLDRKSLSARHPDDLRRARGIRRGLFIPACRG